MKLHSTYFKNVRREVQDGFVRPSFPLNLVSSYRSSSQNPNFQNQPTRDPKIAKLIRSAFVPREGNVLVEIDYVAAEVRCAACYHLDPTMIKYIETGYDLHRDMAAECFKMPKDQVTKGVRYLGKNGFVFPAFYGSWYLEIAQNLWDAAAKEEGLRDHLRSQGIDGLGACDPQQAPREGSFEAHMKGVCDNFWGQRFPVYDEWRNDWFRKYQERGWFKSLTGFVYSGIYKRNEVINYPVQGSAFHWLLWDLIQIQKKIHKTGALIVGQIHDSLLLDVPRHALEDVVALVQDVMCVQVRKHWGWIIVPLDIEVEVGEKNWYEKVEYGVDN
jgi:DNA polymerase-1